VATGPMARAISSALELTPTTRLPHFGFADWLVCQGRLDEALAWSQRARELDPLG